MSDLDDDAIIVNLDGEGDGAIKKIDAGGGVADDPITDLKGQFETLKGTVAKTQQTNQHLSQQLTARDQELTTLRKEVVTSQIDTVTSGLQAAEAEADSAEKDYVAAAEAGDFAAQARAQRKMAAAETKIGRLKEAEDDLKDQTKREPAPVRKTAPDRSSDPVEDFAQNMSARSAAWIRAHPDCITDPKKNARMLAAHNLALADDIAVDTDEYFQRIEAGIAPKAAAKTQDNGGQQQQTSGRRPSSAAAPAGGSSGGMNGGGQEVKLTKREAEAAVDGSLIWNWTDPSGKFKKGDVIGVQEFARRKLQMMKDGHYDRQYTE